MKWVRKSLIWVHRYLGIVLSLMFLMWFLSGIGMIYMRGMPRLSPAVRLARLAPVDLSQVKLSAAEAAAQAGLENPGSATLFTVLDRPAYRFGGRDSATVFADTGAIQQEVDAAQATSIAAKFMELPEEKIKYTGLIYEPDQWTMTQTRQLPLHRFEVQDDAETILYVSPDEAEVVQLTTWGSRTLAWVSVIPHFLYFQALRMNGELWSQVMVWAAGLGVVLAAAGIVIGIWHYRPKGPLPYTGFMRWHYVSGLVFGVLTLTWVFSGLVSLEPWDWTLEDESLAAETRDEFASGPGNLADYPAIDAAAWQQALGGQMIKEVALARIFDEPHFVVRAASGLAPVPRGPDGGHQPYFIQRSTDPERVLLRANPLEVRPEFSPEAIAARVQAALPNVKILETQLLSEYDSYYYSRDYDAPLPVVRVKLDDPAATWLYVDNGVAQIVGRITYLNRIERWTYNALHNLDFPFLYWNRPLWDGVVIVLSLGGALVSGLGVFLGMRRVLRGVARTAKAVAVSKLQ